MLTWNDVTGKTNDHIVPYLTDNVFKNSPVFTRLKSKRRFDFPGGLTIRHNIMYAPLKGGFFQRGQAFDTSAVQTDTALQFNLKYAYVNVTIYGIDQVLNRGTEAAMSFVGSKMINASGTMAQILATSLYGDGQGTLNSTLELDGIQCRYQHSSKLLRIRRHHTIGHLFYCQYRHQCLLCSASGFLARRGADGVWCGMVWSREARHADNDSAGLGCLLE